MYFTRLAMAYLLAIRYIQVAPGWDKTIGQGSIDLDKAVNSGKLSLIKSCSNGLTQSKEAQLFSQD
jgi:hypothetical protein